MSVIYSVYEIKNGENSGYCVTENDDRASAIASAQDYYCERAEQNGEYGQGECDVMIVTYDEKTNIETEEVITLKWYAMKDVYDGGRYDFYTSRI